MYMLSLKAHACFWDCEPLVKNNLTFGSEGGLIRESCYLIKIFLYLVL